jgi:apolipoprotein N-acyltransferase
LSLAVCINPFIIMRETNESSVLYILPIIFLMFLWEKHSAGIINKVICGILGFTAVVLPMAALIFPSSFQFLSNFHTINLINSIVLIIMLYWIRWWVVIPYDYLKNN